MRGFAPARTAMAQATRNASKPDTVRLASGRPGRLKRSSRQFIVHAHLRSPCHPRGKCHRHIVGMDAEWVLVRTHMMRRAAIFVLERPEIDLKCSEITTFLICRARTQRVAASSTMRDACLAFGWDGLGWTPVRVARPASDNKIRVA
jgi:hypothetical protein